MRAIVTAIILAMGASAALATEPPAPKRKPPAPTVTATGIGQASATGGAVTNTVTGGGTSFDGGTSILLAPPGLAGGECVGGSRSGGLTVLALFGLSYGATAEARDCTLRANIELMRRLGEMDIARAMTLDLTGVREAIARLNGEPGPDAQVSLAPPAPQERYGR